MGTVRNWIGAAIFLGCAIGAPASAQVINEVEPNNPCLAAQDLGFQGGLPVVISGALDSNGELLDIDFFRIELFPGDSVQIDLEGGATGGGSLGDPLLGAFDSNCSLIAIDDDGGVSVNSRLTLPVPGDGVLVVAATQFPDFEFIGGGNGSYRLTFNEVRTIDSISGRFFNGVTGEPLPDSAPAFVQLLRCDFGQCHDFVAFQQTDPLGNFQFSQDSAGNALLAGVYQIWASASGFEFYVGEPFEVSENEAANLGDLGLTPLRLIGAVSGRLVNANDGTGLSGVGPPFAGILLEVCDGDFCYGIASASPDELGQFRIEGGIYNIPPGTFRLRGYADGFRQGVSDRFDVAESAEVDVGSFGLTPFPIQVLDITPCEIPAAGGDCHFSFQIRNRDNRRYRGEAWSSIEVYGPPTYEVTRFQVGKVGAGNPMPVRLNLKPNQVQTLDFLLPVPAQVAADTVICSFLTVGREPAPQFNNDGTRFGFCAFKQAGGFLLLSDKDARKQLRDLRRQNRR